MNYLIAFCLLACLALVGAFLNRSPADPLKSKQIGGIVRYVVDGDSLYIEGIKPQIRLWGVDADERGEKGFKAATDLLTKLAKGQRIHCDIIEPDKYGRLVCRCYLKNGKEINRLMIESGKTREYKRFTKGYYSR